MGLEKCTLSLLHQKIEIVAFKKYGQYLNFYQQQRFKFVDSRHGHVH